MDTSEHFLALAAEDKLGEAVVTAEAVLASIGAGMHHSSAHQFFLHLYENFLWNNRFMVTFHVVLWDGAVFLILVLLRKSVV